MSYVSGRKSFRTMQEACDYANRLFQRTGVVVAVERKESRSAKVYDRKTKG